jgi:AcrR family transcriptional regulator
MTPDIRKERETALYEAALRLIAKGVNPAAMKVQQIADEAGIGKGTVYEYFASKDEILQGMALYCFDILGKRSKRHYFNSSPKGNLPIMVVIIVGDKYIC